MKRLGKSVWAGLAAVMALAASGWLWHYGSAERPVVRVGMLHSLTGSLATSENPLVDAARLAIEEVNAAGGIDERRVDALVVDCRSDAPLRPYPWPQYRTRDTWQSIVQGLP